MSGWNSTSWTITAASLAVHQQEAGTGSGPGTQTQALRDVMTPSTYALVSQAPPWALYQYPLQRPQFLTLKKHHNVTSLSKEIPSTNVRPYPLFMVGYRASKFGKGSSKNDIAFWKRYLLTRTKCGSAICRACKDKNPGLWAGLQCSVFTPWPSDAGIYWEMTLRCQSQSPFSLTQICLFYLKVRITDVEGERDIFHPLVHCPDWHYSQSYMGARAKAFTILYCFPGHLQTAGSELEQPGHTLHSYGMPMPLLED